MLLIAYSASHMSQFCAGHRVWQIPLIATPISILSSVFIRDIMFCLGQQCIWVKALPYQSFLINRSGHLTLFWPLQCDQKLLKISEKFFFPHKSATLFSASFLLAGNGTAIVTMEWQHEGRVHANDGRVENRRMPGTLILLWIQSPKPGLFTCGFLVT